MIIGIGVDLLSLTRFRTLLHRRSADRLARRILSPTETTEWKGRDNWGLEREERFLAVRWAAKEAVYKALFPTWGSLKWKEVTLRKTAGSPKPDLLLEAKRELDVPAPTLHLSISHDADLVIAYVVAETK